MKQRTATIIALSLIAVISLTAIIWTLRPDVTPGGFDLEGQMERDVLSEVPGEYRPEEAAFSVRFKDITTSYRVMGMFVMPGEETTIEIPNPDPTAHYEVEHTGGELMPSGTTTWQWRAPDEPGLHPIHIDQRAGEGGIFESTITLNAFVMTPYDLDQEELNGYRIGTYRREPYRANPQFSPPEGFIEVTPALERVLVSPHFMLGEFLCKQVDSYPKYVLLKEELLLKLEWLLRELNGRGIEAPSFHVMSAYRTPFYNRLIGNTTSYSQHLYGGAADIFVDADGDEHMDDITRDGEVTTEDARLLAEIVESQTAKPAFEPLVGGLGIYEPAPHRGPFIHVDVRGVPTRW